MPGKTRIKNYEIYFGDYKSGNRSVKLVRLKDSSLTLYKGDEYDLHFYIEPHNGTYTSVEWTSSVPEVVDIDEDGHIIALSAGKSIITVKINQSIARCIVTVKEIIHFEDPIVKAILVRNYDMDHDGEISYFEARRVTSIPFPMFTGMPIQSFNELAYFTNVKTIGMHAFDSCKNLAYITLPKSVEKIGKNAFSYCNSLTSVTVPENVESIGSEAFSSCANLTIAYIDADIPPRAGNKIFDRCPELDRIIVPGDHINDYLHTVNWGMLNEDEYLYYSYIIYNSFDYTFDFFLS